MSESIEIVVFGAEEKCASCINLPSAYETMEWLEAAVSRKYPDQRTVFRYVDIHDPELEHDRAYAEAILKDEYMYPLVVIGGEVVAEGSPRLKKIYEKIEQL